MITLAQTHQAQIRANADSEIAWRQDAVDAGMATAEETTELSHWKKYRIQTMRIDISTAPNIEWPAQPQSSP